MDSCIQTCSHKVEWYCNSWPKVQTPEETFNNIGKISFINNLLKDFHLFGISVYVLDEKLQGKKIPKWGPRAEVGVYMGYSRERVSNIPYVLNRKIEHIIPQYILYYCDFTTVIATTKSAAVKSWEGLYKQQPSTKV